MKLPNILIAVSLLIMCCTIRSLHASTVQSENLQVKNDTVNAVKIKALTAREAKLQKEMQKQDKKRNATYNGASAEAIEELNNRQDSICLDLRSKLVSVQLEIAEVKNTNLVQAVQSHTKKDKK